jgi:hypothetical protein
MCPWVEILVRPITNPGFCFFVQWRVLARVSPMQWHFRALASRAQQWSAFASEGAFSLLSDRRDYQAFARLAIQVKMACLFLHNTVGTGFLVM